MQTPQIVSLFVSGAVAVMTAYFWLVASRDHRPRLAARWRGVKDATAHEVGGRHFVVARVQFWVSNLSILPNAILGVFAKVLDRGGAWAGQSACPLIDTNAYKEPNELPLTLSPRDLATLDAYVWLPVAPEVLERHRGERDCWKAFAAGLSSPVEFLVELKALGGRTFSLRVAVPASNK